METITLKLIHWPREDNKKDPIWLVETNPTDGSYLPICQIATNKNTTSDALDHIKYQMTH